MKQTKAFFFSKVSDTAADIFTAIGFAYLMAQSFPSLKNRTDIWIRDRGSCYEVEFPTDPLNDMTPNSPSIFIFDPVVTEAQKNKRADLAGYHLSHQRSIVSAYFQRVRELSPLQRLPSAIRQWHQQANIPLPHPLHEQYETIIAMQSADTFNDIALRWAALSREQQQWHIQLLLTLFESPFKDVDFLQEAMKRWKQFAKTEGISGPSEVTALQLVNPAQGKGSNSSKANNLTLGSMKQFWLLELLKFLGFLHASLSYTVRGSTGDRKIYAPHPANITLHRVLSLVEDMRNLCWSAPHIQLDIQLLLLCTSLLVKERRDHLQEKIPYPPLKGWEVTQYKFMGKAYILMNTSFLGLPCWINSADSPQECTMLLALIDHQCNLLRTIDEQDGSERQLLDDYRKFLSGNDQEAFLRFAAAYGLFFLSTKAQDKEHFLPMLNTSELSYIVAKLSDFHVDVR